MTTRHAACLVFVLALCALATVPATNAVAQDAAPGPLTVAVLDFETKDKGDLGAKIADLLTVFLSADEKLQLVERAKIKQILDEFKLSKTGLVDPNQAVRVGGLLGAQVLVTGRAFVVNEKLYVTVKAISVETSRVNGQLAKGELDADLDTIVQDVATKLTAWLGENSDKMVAAVQTPADRIAQLRKALGAGAMPTLAVVIIEAHVGQATIDPAAETEMTYLAKKVGIPVVNANRKQVSEWAAQYLKDAKIDLPGGLGKADVLIVGEGFSEYAGRVEDLLSVKARVEVKAIDARTGAVLAIQRQTVTHVDLSEQIAGKAALQKAAGQAAVELLPEAVAAWRKGAAKD